MVYSNVRSLCIVSTQFYLSRIRNLLFVGLTIHFSLKINGTTDETETDFDIINTFMFDDKNVKILNLNLYYIHVSNEK